ncbi:hypothetical protein BH11ACT2_BH11ACT2_15400 [soil metagenome]
MKVTTFGKIAISAGACALLVGGFATSAQADPAAGTFGTLVGAGSDTTQDVVNALAAASNGAIASYDATGHSTPVQVRADGGTLPRVSGSGAGIDTLRVAIGQTATAGSTALSDGTKVTIDSSVVGKIDFARSSSAPATADQSAVGSLTYIPFAKDAVDVAYAGSAASLLANVPLSVGTAATTTDPSLLNIYSGDIQYLNFSGTNTYVSATKDKDTDAGITSYRIQPLLPKNGSGTRKYFVGKISLKDLNTYSSLSSYIKDVDTNGTTPLEEHDGTGIADYTVLTGSNPVIAISPFSIGQWVAQGNSATTKVTDRRHGVVLAKLGVTAGEAVSALVESAGSPVTPYQTNSSYAAMVRDVYNVVPTSLANTPASNIAKAFVGSGSFVCAPAQASIITTYGFLTAPNCGSVSLKAYARSVSTTTLSVPASALVGSSVTATASVVSVNNLGGQVQFLNGSSVLATATIPAGSSSASATFAASAVGTVPVTAQFIPAATGVASSVSAASTVAIAATASTTTFTAPKLTVGKASKVTVTVAGGDALGGTVQVKNGSTVIGSATVAAGAGSAVVTVTPTAIKNSLTAVYTPKTGAVIGSTSVVASVKAAKGTVKITVSKVKTVKFGKTSKVAIKVSGVVTPTGTVTVKEGKKTLTKTAKLVKGKVTVSLKKLKKGTHKIVVTYNGNSVFKSGVKSKTTKVKIA